MSASSRGEVWAVVPLKERQQAKSRLAPILTAAHRRSLQEAMLQDVIAALRSAEQFDRIVIVTADTDPVMAGDAQIDVHRDASFKELNVALNAAASRAHRHCAAAVCIVAADLPCATSDDFRTIVSMWRKTGRSILVPDLAREGSNCLLVPARRRLSFAFGAGSFERHSRLFTDDAGPPITVPAASLSIDIDRPSDVERLRRMLCGANTAAWLTATGLLREGEDAA